MSRLFPFLAVVFAGSSWLKILSFGKKIFHSGWKTAIPAWKISVPRRIYFLHGWRHFFPRYKLLIPGRRICFPSGILFIPDSTNFWQSFWQVLFSWLVVEPVETSVKIGFCLSGVLVVVELVETQVLFSVIAKIKVVCKSWACWQWYLFSAVVLVSGQVA